MCFPLFAYECGRHPLYCRPFPVLASAVFLHQHRVIVTALTRMAARFHFYALGAQAVRLDNVMS